MPLSALGRHTTVPVPPPGAPGLFAFADPSKLRTALDAAGFCDVALDEVAIVNGGEFDGGGEYLAVIPAAAGASNPDDHQFTVVAHNDEGTATPADFFDTLVQNAQQFVDAPVYLDGDAVGSAERILTVTRAGDDVALIIDCSIELPDGNGFFNGSVHLADVGDGASLPVIGGTGLYNGARGTVVMTITDPAQPELAFDFTTE